MMDLQNLRSPGVPATPSASPWYLNPFLYLALNGLLVTASELLFKRGAMATSNLPAPFWLGWLGFTALESWWVWAGVACAILSFIAWLHVLRSIPLSIAFPLASLVHVLIPLGAWAFLDEVIRPVRWCGIALIIAGIWLTASQVTHAEEEL
jgi:multidrug transporter EmrE-like cation transporter